MTNKNSRRGRPPKKKVVDKVVDDIELVEDKEDTTISVDDEGNVKAATNDGLEDAVAKSLGRTDEGVVISTDTGADQGFVSAAFETVDIVVSENPNPITKAVDPLLAAIGIIGGCDSSHFNIAGDLRRSTPDEFFFYQYGVGISFLLDEKTGMYRILNHRSKPSSTAACYWLLDKLVAETKGKLFFSPGRETIVR